MGGDVENCSYDSYVVSEDENDTSDTDSSENDFVYESIEENGNVGHELEIRKISPRYFFLIFCAKISLNLKISELQTKKKNSNYNDSYDF